MTPTPEELQALERLETSVRDLRGQMTNPAAYQHHVQEAIGAVITDAQYLGRIIQTWKAAEPEEPVQEPQEPHRWVASDRDYTSACALCGGHPADSIHQI